MLEIPILGRRISVRFVSDKDLSQIAKDSECWGCYENDTIYISSSIGQEHGRRIVLHELTHAILTITGLTNILESNQEEAVCDASEALLDAFRDETLVKFLSDSGE